MKRPALAVLAVAALLASNGLAARPDGGFQLLWSDSRDGMYRLRTSTVNVMTTEGERK